MDDYKAMVVYNLNHPEWPIERIEEQITKDTKSFGEIRERYTKNGELYIKYGTRQWQSAHH